ncbi:hypothetical protein VTL71DRAFT_13444 [Oculimacula yallundae]|uniref:Fumarylacetoacetate hydrolase n=1 Tax=Oculimacula yallundae TaxID=86028 RepID=A0ABR4CMF2_9HELO
MATSNQSIGSQNTFTNYVAYCDSNANEESRIGHLDQERSTIQPLSFLSGAPLTNLYEVIEIEEANIKPSGDPFQLSSVKLLPTISGRDILAVGKNYFEHAIEFNTSGYDSSDKMDQPTHPVIFTKRATSIIAHGDPIFPHPGFTETPDYEGEIGVIVGKSGFRIEEADALDYVWGYTIINDMTARERQRDHKQFYIGKSPDTFCPIGPIAVPASKLPKTLRVQTHVNGEKRQDSTTDDLIFSVPFLIKTISEGQTIRPGDVIATGTPAGVGFGQKPPVWLKPGDVVSVSVTGLGVLSNPISKPTDTNQTVARVAKETHVRTSNSARIPSGTGLRKVNSKELYYRHMGDQTKRSIIFIHGLGGSSEVYTPLISTLGLDKAHSLHLLDLEGHGLSPTSALSHISISSYAQDFQALAEQLQITQATVIAHSMGCLIALDLISKFPDLVSDLVLLGPPPSPVPEAGRNASAARALTVRSLGMAAVVDAVVTAGTSEISKKENLLGVSAVRMSLLGQDPEGYAKGCTALAGASEALPLKTVTARTLIVTGEEDKVSPPQICDKYASEIKDAKVTVLPQVGHWHMFEDLKGVAAAVGSFL